MSGGVMRACIDARIAQLRADDDEPRYLMIAESAWPVFKTEVPRREYRKRVGSRFINSYRGIPISIHDEWSWGWDLMPAARLSQPSTQNARSTTGGGHSTAPGLVGDGQ